MTDDDIDRLLAIAANFDNDKVDPHSRYVIVKLADAVRDLRVRVVAADPAPTEDLLARANHIANEASWTQPGWSSVQATVRDLVAEVERLRAAADPAPTDPDAAEADMRSVLNLGAGDDDAWRDVVTDQMAALRANRHIVAAFLAADPAPTDPPDAVPCPRCGQPRPTHTAFLTCSRCGLHDEDWWLHNGPAADPAPTDPERHLREENADLRWVVAHMAFNNGGLPPRLVPLVNDAIENHDPTRYSVAYWEPPAAADPAPTDLTPATLDVISEWFSYHHGWPCAYETMNDLRQRLAAADPAPTDSLVRAEPAAAPDSGSRDTAAVERGHDDMPAFQLVGVDVDTSHDDVGASDDLAERSDLPHTRLCDAMTEAADTAPTGPDGPCEGCGRTAAECCALPDDDGVAMVCCILCTHIDPALDMPGPDTTEGGR